jgi:hypothetical protein
VYNTAVRDEKLPRKPLPKPEPKKKPEPIDKDKKDVTVSSGS